VLPQGWKRLLHTTKAAENRAAKNFKKVFQNIGTVLEIPEPTGSLKWKDSETRLSVAAWVTPWLVGSAAQPAWT